MQSKQAWDVINQQRRAIADLLTGLDETEWDLPSWCDGWTVREVAAHLLRERPALDHLAQRPRSLLARRTNLDERVMVSLRAGAARPVGAIVADLRSLAGRRHRTEGPFWSYVLLEVLVHGQDIARPLERRLPMPVEAAEVAATRAWRHRDWQASARLDGFCLTADDSDWRVGSGPRISGSIEQLLLLTTGRDAILPELSGPGQVELVNRLVPAG